MHRAKPLAFIHFYDVVRLRPHANSRYIRSLDAPRDGGRSETREALAAEHHPCERTPELRADCGLAHRQGLPRAVDCRSARFVGRQFLLQSPELALVDRSVDGV